MGNPKIMGSNLDLTVFKPWLSQTNDVKIDTCHSIAWHSALLGSGKDWLAQCQNNLTECDSRSSHWQPGVPVRQHYKITMSAYKSLPILI